jgi:hypothetical protein
VPTLYVDVVLDCFFIVDIGFNFITGIFLYGTVKRDLISIKRDLISIKRDLISIFLYGTCVRTH